ncbi:hypothetical protein D9M71_493510 [compost metagenome]
MQARQRRIGNPAGLGEFADAQGQVDQHHAGNQQPEAQGVQERVGNVTRADLQRHCKVHQAGEEWHRHEDDHDHTVGGEDLVIVFRWQVARRTLGGHGQLGTHHDGVGKAAQQHDHGDDDVHHADFLVVDRRQPLGPQVGPLLEVGDCSEQRQTTERDHGDGHHHDRLVERDRFPT